MSTDQRFAIVGGGMTGLTAALRLAQAGYSVDLYEAHDHVGGLSDSYSWNGVIWDRFYHVVLSTDTRLLSLIKELDLHDEIYWKETKSGFYGGGKLVSLSDVKDFITFPFLSLWQKFRLGMGILVSESLKDPTKLDKIYVREWLIRIFGRQVYERMWDPLLRSKLGDARQLTSAAFIWATIKRLYGARSGESKIEKMGYVRGGYTAILEAIERRLYELGVSIHTNTAVTAIELETVESGESTGVRVRSRGYSKNFNKVLLTVSAPVVLRLTGKAATDDTYWQALENVQYLGVLCLFVVLDRKLSPYYVINLLEPSLPFTGILEVTNIIEPSSIDNHHLVYLPRYVTQNDPLLKAPDETVTNTLLAGLRKVFPELPQEAIRHTRLFREQYVQPLQEVDYLEQTRGIKTPIPGVYLANSTLLYNSTLNNNASIWLAEKAVGIMTDEDNEEENCG